MVEVSFVIPVYNNEDTIRKLSNQLYKLCNEIYQFEIVFVNDDSKDNSLETIKTLSKEFNFVKLKNLSKNGGQNKAIIEGLKVAKGERIIVMDADLQDNLKMVSPLINSLIDDVDAVYILRKGKYQSSMRMLTSFILKGCVQLIIGLPRKAGTFFIIRKEIVPKLLKLRCTFPYVTIMAFYLAKKVVYLPSKRYLDGGKSAYTFKKRVTHAMKAFICALQCRFFN